jgi:16S rRNA (uracil1498-N3)-methyltransferase
MTAPMFLADAHQLRGPTVVLDGPEGHHAADVKRLRVGEAVSVGDGAGLVVRGVVADVRRGLLVVDVRERVEAPAADPAFVVVQALPKGGRDTDAIEAMTEVGVDEVVGWAASRSVAKWTDRTTDKWRATVREAAKQSRRAWVPRVGGPASTADVVARLGAAAAAVVLHEEASAPLADVALPATGEVVVVVGPEGGIAPDELDAFVAAGATVRRLGDAVLRTSTAGVAALAVLSAKHRWLTQRPTR